MFASVFIFKSHSHTSKMKKKKQEKTCLLKGCWIGAWDYIEESHYLLKSFFPVTLVTSYMYALLICSGKYRIEEPREILFQSKNQI